MSAQQISSRESVGVKLVGGHTTVLMFDQRYHVSLGSVNSVRSWHMQEKSRLGIRISRRCLGCNSMMFSCFPFEFLPLLSLRLDFLYSSASHRLSIRTAVFVEKQAGRTNSHICFLPSQKGALDVGRQLEVSPLPPNMTVIAM